MASIDDYTKLVASEHSDKPNFMAMVSAALQPIVDLQNLMASFPSAFDVEVAVGTQLDVVGQWVGRSRALTIPINNPYFSLDIDGLGLDESVWLRPFDPATHLVQLPDDAYRILLLAIIGANQWDGTIEGAYSIFDIVFRGFDFQLLINETGVMSISFSISGPLINVVTKALITDGELITKPAGVHVDGYNSATLPLFAFDSSTNVYAGFDTGNWEQPA
jgi:Protein of unknown function (DUF2612)